MPAIDDLAADFRAVVTTGDDATVAALETALADDVMLVGPLGRSYGHSAVLEALADPRFRSMLAAGEWSVADDEQGVVALTCALPEDSSSIDHLPARVGGRRPGPASRVADHRRHATARADQTDRRNEGSDQRRARCRQSDARDPRRCHRSPEAVVPWHGTGVQRRPTRAVEPRPARWDDYGAPRQPQPRLLFARQGRERDVHDVRTRACRRRSRRPAKPSSPTRPSTSKTSTSPGAASRSSSTSTRSKVQHPADASQWLVTHHRKRNRTCSGDKRS